MYFFSYDLARIANGLLLIAFFTSGCSGEPDVDALRGLKPIQERAVWVRRQRGLDPAFGIGKAITRGNLVPGMTPEQVRAMYRDEPRHIIRDKITPYGFFQPILGTKLVRNREA